MIERMAAVAVATMVLASPAFAQAKKAANAVVYDVTVTAEGTPYTGTMTLAISGGKVTGDMLITVPTQITGKPAGTAKAGKLNLDFTYRMVERACDGQIAITIDLPAQKAAAPTTGTADIGPCGEPGGNRIPGTVEMKAKAATKK